MENITLVMQILEAEILIQQSYIFNHGDANDAGEPDKVWDQYKIDAQYNIDKWDDLKKIRDTKKFSNN